MNQALSQLDKIKKDFSVFRAQSDALKRKQMKNGRFVDLYRVLRQSCDLIRSAEEHEDTNLRAIIDEVEVFVAEVVRYATDGRFGQESLVEHMESFAHRWPPVESMPRNFESDDGEETPDKQDSDLVREKKLPEGVYTHRFLSYLVQFVQIMRPQGSIPMRTPDPYDPSTRPHHLSSPLARFQTFSGLSPTASTPLANVLYEARLEATHDPIALPVILHMAPGGSCLALLSMGGYMNRDPRLEYILFDQDTQSRNFRFPTEQSLQLPFTEAATRCAIDEERKLIFTADEERIKSFAWGDYSDRSAAGTIFKEPLPVHTLNTWSPEAKGPIALRGDRILRSGTDVILAWNIDDLDQHEPGSEAPLGGEFPIDSDDEDADDIEPSAGNKFHNLVKLKTKNFSIGEWHPHPSASGNMLAGADHYYRQSSVLTACYALDLETGEVATKYIGHGGPVGTFSTSAGDPNVFLTGCDDGYVRLYDTRQPLPILTVDVSSLHDPCSSALFVHPDGVPTIFTGSEKAQNIKLWDVRARAVVYELATGNNAVISMVWDDTRNALYAATECEYLTSYMSHESYNKDYRRATIPKWQTEKVPTILKSSTREAGPSGVNRDAAEDPTGDDTDWVDEDDSYDGEEDEDDFEYGGGRRWPKQAEHAEDYFGHTFDASQHRVYRFAFKADANPDILPGFGTFDY